jgi:hypothetical protein
MARDAPFASLADGRRGLVRLLHHGADQAGEIRDTTPQKRLAKGNIGEDTVQGIVVVVIGRSGKQCPRHLGPVIRRGYAKLILALEMVEEGPFGDARRGAELLDRSGRIAFGADDRQSGVDQLGSSVPLGIGLGHTAYIPTGRYVVNGG